MPSLAPLSDLHLEFFKPQEAVWPSVNPAADLIVLAGDIARGMASLNGARSIAQKAAKPVIWVAGNHEFYHHDIDQLSKAFEAQSAAALLDGVYCVEYMEPVVLEGIRFTGCTLWTDCSLYQGVPRLKTQQDAIEKVEQYLNDFRTIQKGKRSFTAQDSVELHRLQYTHLLNKLSQPFAGKTVVVTHHGVHCESIAARYNPGSRIVSAPKKLPGENTNWMLNPGFASHLPGLHEQVELCIHGHTHERIHYKDSRSWIVANPRGYPHKTSTGEAFEFENRSYDEQLLLSIEAHQ